MIFSRQSLGVVLVAVMLARWVWVFAVPVSVAMPATVSWKKSNAADNLFGQPLVVDTNAVAASNYQLIGVFAHPTAGFAVLLVDGKQLGVGLGGTVADGMRLTETHADFVILERGEIKQRVQLVASNAASVINPVATIGAAVMPPSDVAATAPAKNDGSANAPAATESAAPLPPGVDPLKQRDSPHQRAHMKQELKKSRGQN